MTFHQHIIALINTKLDVLVARGVLLITSTVICTPVRMQRAGVYLMLPIKMVKLLQEMHQQDQCEALLMTLNDQFMVDFSVYSRVFSGCSLCYIDL